MNHSQYVLIRCLALAAAVIAVAAACFGCAAKGVTGNEWLLMQEERLDELELLADNMDEVFSLYVMGAIGSTDFLTEIELLKQQYAVMNEMYDAEKREYPILPENNSYAAQKGVEGLERVREILGAILNNAAADGVPPPARRGGVHVYGIQRRTGGQPRGIHNGGTIYYGSDRRERRRC